MLKACLVTKIFKLILMQILNIKAYLITISFKLDKKTD